MRNRAELAPLPAFDYIILLFQTAAEYVKKHHKAASVHGDVLLKVCKMDARRGLQPCLASSQISTY